MTQVIALWLSALLFGGMTLYSFGFAAFVFRNLGADEAGRLLRRAFPIFYLLVIVTAAFAGIFLLFSDILSALLCFAIALTTIPARQRLMPAINAASDAGNTKRFGLLHGASVGLTLLHIALAAWILARFA